jgi:hypothetical protein
MFAHEVGLLRDDAMSDEDANQDGGTPREPEARYQGPAHAAPYGLSRLAPAYDLVDTAREIQKADQTLATMTGGKLAVIAEQIQALQEQARALLERARRDAELHRARCRFEKKPGAVYHLYRRDDGERWFSMLSPADWKGAGAAGQTFEGSFRLELDMSFTRVDVAEEPSAVVAVAPLLGVAVSSAVR